MQGKRLRAVPLTGLAAVSGQGRENRCDDRKEPRLRDVRSQVNAPLSFAAVRLVAQNRPSRQNMSLPSPLGGRALRPEKPNARAAFDVVSWGDTDSNEGIVTRSGYAAANGALRSTCRYGRTQPCLGAYACCQQQSYGTGLVIRRSW